jgi:hypothetical protein
MCRRTTLHVRRWKVLPAHPFSAAPAMDLYCRRTKKISASGIKFEEIWPPPKILGTLPPGIAFSVFEKIIENDRKFKK